MKSTGLTPARLARAEVLYDGCMSRAGCVYSFGVVLWELLAGSRAWAGLNQRAGGSNPHPGTPPQPSAGPLLVAGAGSWRARRRCTRVPSALYMYCTPAAP